MNTLSVVKERSPTFKPAVSYCDVAVDRQGQSNKKEIGSAANCLTLAGSNEILDDKRPALFSLSGAL